MLSSPREATDNYRSGPGPHLQGGRSKITLGAQNLWNAAYIWIFSAGKVGIIRHGLGITAVDGSDKAKDKTK